MAPGRGRRHGRCVLREGPSVRDQGPPAGKNPTRISPGCSETYRPGEGVGVVSGETGVSAPSWPSGPMSVQARVGSGGSPTRTHSLEAACINPGNLTLGDGRMSLGVETRALGLTKPPSPTHPLTFTSPWLPPCRAPRPTLHKALSPLNCPSRPLTWQQNQGATAPR